MTPLAPEAGNEAYGPCGPSVSRQPSVVCAAIGETPHMLAATNASALHHRSHAVMGQAYQSALTLKSETANARSTAICFAAAAIGTTVVPSMSLVHGYLLAELLSPPVDSPAHALGQPFRDRIDARRAQLASLNRKQRAATLVASFRLASQAPCAGRLSPTVWQRLQAVEPNEVRTSRELEELSGD